MGVGMGIAVAQKVQVAKKEEERRNKLLKLLTYEVIDGKPIYYRGYKDVLAGKKQPEEVMGSSTLHARLVILVGAFLKNKLGDDYEVMGGELGYFVEGGWRNLDVAVFRYSDVKDKLESRNYIDVPPVLVVEIDTHAEVESDLNYIIKKVDDLLNSGAAKVVWILTEPKKVMLFERGKKGIILDWGDDIPLIEGLNLNLHHLLKRP